MSLTCLQGVIKIHLIEKRAGIASTFPRAQIKAPGFLRGPLSGAKSILQDLPSSLAAYLGSCLIIGFWR